ncbi:hypothetical protein HRI_002996000 [Hibiscus trionum]|uniref:Cystatin domain-containing protein n=1 Tax=Hibiscus trionum TaxID=183268 RepID=A0A9W7IBT5_HIBTR|nr:hypothetical protein HRI_002996000 [Hibiscus trionum]
MQQVHHFLVLVLPLLFLSLIISDASEYSVAGGWTPIKNINDPYVTEIAKFAVDEFNKKGNTSLKLVLVAVVSGETQVVSGTNYRLILKATYGTATKAYRAIVWENAWLNKKLTSFEPFLG